MSRSVAGPPPKTELPRQPIRACVRPGRLVRARVVFRTTRCVNKSRWLRRFCYFFLFVSNDNNLTRRKHAHTSYVSGDVHDKLASEQRQKWRFIYFVVRCAYATTTVARSISEKWTGSKDAASSGPGAATRKLAQPPTAAAGARAAVRDCPLFRHWSIRISALLRRSLLRRRTSSRFTNLPLFTPQRGTADYNYCYARYFTIYNIILQMINF